MNCWVKIGHHIMQATYHILQECLAFFSRRRLAVKSAMRNNNDTTNNQQNNNSKTLSEQELTTTTLIHTYAKKSLNLNPNVHSVPLHPGDAIVFIQSLRCGSCYRRGIYEG